MKYVLLAAILFGVGGCVYDPGYSYVRPSGYYDASGSGGYYAGDGYYNNGYYDGGGDYDNGYYGDCVNCGPTVSLGFGYGYGYGGYPYYGGYYGGGYYHRRHDWDDHRGGRGDHDHAWHGGHDHDHDHNGRSSHGSPQAWNQSDRPPIPHRGNFERAYKPANTPTRGSSMQQPVFNQNWADRGTRPMPSGMPPQMGNAGPRPSSVNRGQSNDAPRTRAPRNRNGSNVERQ